MMHDAAMTGADALRPIERRVLQLIDDGYDDGEIGRRFRRSPAMIRRIVGLTDIPRSKKDNDTRTAALRPLEQRVLRWRDAGSDYAEIARRFGRSPQHMERVEALARYKLERS
jgi:DNA-binding CsgD family transcriptional regulator